jgi:hypothetical protein
MSLIRKVMRSITPLSMEPMPGLTVGESGDIVQPDAFRGEVMLTGCFIHRVQ